jgi:hypothetical protein
MQQDGLRLSIVVEIYFSFDGLEIRNLLDDNDFIENVLLDGIL